MRPLFDLPFQFARVQLGYQHDPDSLPVIVAPLEHGVADAADELADRRLHAVLPEVGVLAVEWGIDDTGEYDDAVERVLGCAQAYQAGGEVVLGSVHAVADSGVPDLVGALVEQALTPFEGDLPVRAEASDAGRSSIIFPAGLTVAGLRGWISTAYPATPSYEVADLTQPYVG